MAATTPPSSTVTATSSPPPKLLLGQADRVEIAGSDVDFRTFHAATPRSRPDRRRPHRPDGRPDHAAGSPAPSCARRTATATTADVDIDGAAAAAAATIIVDGATVERVVKAAFQRQFGVAVTSTELVAPDLLRIRAPGATVEGRLVVDDGGRDRALDRARLGHDPQPRSVVPAPPPLDRASTAATSGSTRPSTPRRSSAAEADRTVPRLGRAPAARAVRGPLLSFGHDGPAPHDRPRSRDRTRAAAASAPAARPIGAGRARRPPRRPPAPRQADRPAPDPEPARRPSPRPESSPTSARSRRSSSRPSASTTRRPTSSPIERAFDLAVEAHDGQRRATGEPYVTHPIASAQITAELGIDPVAVTAALLHDVPEDTEYGLTDIEDRFGPEVARLVDGVTKLSKFSTHSHEQQQAENIRKMLLAMAEDIRVVLIKLADRLHNMRTLYGLPSEKQLRIARQTQEIYAPLAERLGIWQIKWELEDLAFKVLEPERFRELARLLDTRRKGREDYIARAIAELTPAARRGRASRPTSRAARSTSTASTRRCSASRAEFAEIYDVYAIRILVDEVRDCYAALGIVHALWRPIPGQFDDYIAVPKNNLYQSLHTAVIALDGKPLEIQIRTHAMHQVERGRHRRPLALQGRHEVRPRVRREARLAAPAHGLAARRQRSDATEFVEGIKLDIFQDQVFVFTPKGDIKDLPGRRDAARLRLPDPHRRRPPDDRGEGQQPARPARLPAEERRHRRDRDDEGRARPVARLDERRPDLPRPREDPPMVQAQGPRREHRPRPRVARARAPAARPQDAIQAVGHRPDRRGRPRPTTTRRSTTSTRRSATARSAPSRS